MYTLFMSFSNTLENIVLSNPLTISISIITLAILFFILMPQELLNMTNILSLVTNGANDVICDSSIDISMTKIELLKRNY